MSTAKTQSQTPHLQRFSGEWETKRLQDILDINPQNFSSNTNPAYKFNYISLEQVDSGRLLGYAEEVFQTAPSRAQRILQSGDVLMSTVRPNLMAHLFFHDQVPNAVCSTGFAVLRSKHDLSAPYFIFAQLFSQNVNNQIAKILAGSNYPAINSRDVKLIEIPCPPQICEQRAIAEVLSDVDGLIGALDALIAKKREIKLAAMQQLLTGKTRLPGFNGEWKMKQLGELIHLIPSGIYGLGTQTGQLIGMPVVTTAHIDLNDRWNEKQMNIRYFTEGQIEHYSPLEGDLIVVKSSGSAASIQSGKIGYVSAGKTQSFVFSNFLMLLRPIGCNAQFLFFQLTSGRVKQMFPQLVEASTYPNLRINDYLEVQIPLPPEEEQLAIVNVLSDMDTGIAALERRRDKTRAIKQGMMQQLLTGRVRLVKFDVAL